MVGLSGLLYITVLLFGEKKKRKTYTHTHTHHTINTHTPLFSVFTPHKAFVPKSCNLDYPKWWEVEVTYHIVMHMSAKKKKKKAGEEVSVK